MTEMALALAHSLTSGASTPHSETQTDMHKHTHPTPVSHPTPPTPSSHLWHHLSRPLQREYVSDVVSLVARTHQLGAACPAGHLCSKHGAAQLSVQLSNLTAVQRVLTNLCVCGEGRGVSVVYVGV